MEKEAAAARFEVLSEHWPWENEENHEETSRPNVVSFVVVSDSNGVMTLTNETTEIDSQQQAIFPMKWHLYTYI